MSKLIKVIDGKEYCRRDILITSNDEHEAFLRDVKEYDCRIIFKKQGDTSSLLNPNLVYSILVEYQHDLEMLLKSERREVLRARLRQLELEKSLNSNVEELKLLLPEVYKRAQRGESFSIAVTKYSVKGELIKYPLSLSISKDQPIDFVIKDESFSGTFTTPGPYLFQTHRVFLRIDNKDIHLIRAEHEILYDAIAAMEVV